jgi:type VI secretion system protein ImpH
MPSPSRRKNTSLSNKIIASPSDYGFLQTVRLLERAAKYSHNETPDKNRDLSFGNPVARFVPPNTEVIRFQTNQTFRFSSSEIAKISKKLLSADSKKVFQWKVSVNFMGLTGSQGVLPYHYTELILKRLKIKDESLVKFLDLFNHRMISLFYQSSTKYRLPIEYERKKLNPPTLSSRDAQTQALLSLIGMGTKHLTNRQYINDESLLYYSGLFTQQVRTVSGLKQILQDHFNVPVKIKEFVGQWQDLIDDVRSKFPSREEPLGQNNRLGKTTMLGKKGWFAQGKIRIILGPLNKKQTQKFAPGTKALYAMDEIIRFYIGLENEYDIIVRISRKDSLDKAKMSASSPPIIGWNTWLVSKPKQDYNKDETLDISISSKQFQ